MNTWIFFLFLTLICVCFQAFFSMFEMASVTFNKVRLHYYVSNKKKRAKWLSYLLEKPSRLFGTTLICVNAALQLGSECSRKFYEAIGANPDFAPISQIIIVMIFGELAPLFAARRHSETVAMRFVPIVYGMYFLLNPIIKALDFLTRLVSRKERENYLSRDELKKAFIDPIQNLDEPIENIFSIKTKRAKQILIPLSDTAKIVSTATLDELSHLLTVDFHPFILVFHRTEGNIVGVIHSRILLKEHQNTRVIDEASPPWFISEDVYILDILKQFRTNNQNMAVVLNSSGEATGVITLDQIISYLIGEESDLSDQKKVLTIVEKTLSGDMTLEEFNKTFDANLFHPDAEDLSELIFETLRHHPVKGEVIYFDRFEMVVLEPGIVGAKTLLVRTI